MPDKLSGFGWLAYGVGEEAHTGNRTHNKTEYLPRAGKPPRSVDWEQWIGPVQMHPYNPEYLTSTRGPGSGCLSWNMYNDFGSWQVGDMGSHVMDLAWNAIDADRPTSAKASGDVPNGDVCPSAMTAIFEMPANSWRDDMEYTNPRYDDGTPMTSGHISLQAESHPCQFRNIEILELD